MLLRLLLLLLLGGAEAQKSLRQAAAAEVVTDSTATEAECGVSGVLQHGHMQQPTSLAPTCGKMFQTNCSVSYQPMACPSDCDYIVPNKAFTCIFECASAETCSEKNPNTAFPDPAMKVCRKCNAVGCKLCSTEDKCSVCHSGFELHEHRCYFSLFLALEPPIKLCATVVGVVVVLLAIFGIIWHCARVRHSDDPNREMNAFSVERSRVHRQLVKVVRWHLGDRKKVAEHYSMFANLHDKNCLGLGIALFYNSMLFMICFSVLIFGITFVAYTASRASVALSQFDPDDSLLLRRAVHPALGYPAIVLSRLSVCSAERQRTLQDDLSLFYKRNFVCMSILYVLAFAMTLFHAFLQKQFIVWFDIQNQTMSDYALSITGLPTDCTDEGALREWVERKFRGDVSMVMKRPSVRITGRGLDNDREEARPDSQVEIYGVSICYDYTSREEEVDRMVQEMNMRFEVEESMKSGKGLLKGKGLRHSFVGGPFLLKSQREEHRKKVEQWFESGEEGTRMLSTGKAYVVFRYSDDKEKVFKFYEESPEELTYKDGSQLKVKEVLVEPPSVRWQHLGIKKDEVRWNFKMAVLKSLLMVLLFQLFIFAPYAYFILLPFSRIGSDAGGVVITVAGVVLGTLNGVLSSVIRDLVWHVGFHTKEVSESLVLWLDVVVTLVNTFLNLAILTYTIAMQHGETVLDLVYSESFSSIATLNSIARSIYLTMMPGSFFVGYLLTPLVGGVIPYLQTTLFMKLIYIWRVFPRCLLRVFKNLLPYAPESLDRYPYYCAEKAMEPGEVTTGDYVDLFVLPTVSCTTLFFLSPFVWKTFFWMMVWSGFFYVFMKYKHLRLSKQSFCTTDHTDRLVNYMWGFPLSIIAAAWFFWGYHAKLFGDLPEWAVVVLMVAVFGFSYLLWFLSYHFGVRPGKTVSDRVSKAKERLSIEEVKAGTLYCWMNCNPVFTLKCEYYFLGEDGASIAARRQQHPLACGEDPDVVRFYTEGKQYLFIPPDRHYLATVPPDSLEFENYLERGLSFLGMVMGLCAARTESSVRGYLMIEGEEQERSPKKQLVVVKQKFMSSNKKEKQELMPGLEGFVHRIDSTGDALVKFEGLDSLQWVSRKHFEKVDGLNPPAEGDAA